jgi:pimeloyl-ACP methyl ester carboxylesterase
MATFRPDVLHEYVEHGFETLADGTARLKCRPSDEARVYAYGGSHRAYSRLSEIACAVTLTCGELTDSFGLATLEAVGQRLRDRRIEVFPGLGHFGPLEDPEAVAASMIRAFDIPPA